MLLFLHEKTLCLTNTLWSLSMHQIESCNCSHGCGCQFGGFPDTENGSCEAILGFKIIEGHLNDLDLTG